MNYSIKTFEVKNIALEKANLIEASAGTGKTYSIAILVLRLLLEKAISIDRILMVTFTNKAVAELEVRIRSFIRKAYQIAYGDQEEKDQTIRDIVNTAIELQGEEKTKKLLTVALRQLDEVQVSTIHGFCQNTISQFAFETDQSFNQNIIANTDDIINDALLQYRREKLNTIADQEVFEELHRQLNYEAMVSAANKVMDGKKLYESTKDIPSTDFATLFKGKEPLKNEIFRVIERDFEKIKSLKLRSNLKLKKSLSIDIEAFKETYISEFDNSPDKLHYFESLEDLYTITNQYIKLNNDIKLKRISYYIDFINYAIEKVEAYKRRNGVITYDDLILRIREAADSNVSFQKEMAVKYDAIFIDEFQDTDANQYTIFKKLYADLDKIVFYIGDPKQSIYGFRKADLDVYKQAKEDIGFDHLFTMNNNFRGTEALINATNLLLGESSTMNLFLDNDISYYPVKAGNKSLGSMIKNATEVNPIDLIETEDMDTNVRFVAEEIKRLLTDGTQITKSKKSRNIRPSDIGIIVRSNREAKEYQQMLLRMDIPAIIKDTEKIFNSLEADYLSYLIEAILNPSRGKINRILFRNYFGFGLNAIRDLDMDRHAEIFRELLDTLRKSGIYNTVEAFLSVYGIRKVCIKDLAGQRILTNITHLTELLHEAEQRHQLSPETLISWIKHAERHIMEEENRKRIESEENAVQISTIHSCKGLAYNIVFAVGLGTAFNAGRTSGKLIDFKMNNVYWFTSSYSDLDDQIKEIIQKADEKENRRLLYVTLTRPVYKCYICWFPRKNRSTTIETTISNVINGKFKIEGQTTEGIRYKKVGSFGDNPKKTDLKKEDKLPTFAAKQVGDRPLFIKSSTYSFSSLSEKHKITPFEPSTEADDYTQFVLNELPRGTEAGLFLHALFEELDFSDKEAYQKAVAQTGRAYPNLSNSIDSEKLLELVRKVLSTPLQAGEDTIFSLDQIGSNRKRPEIEFYFHIKDSAKSTITECWKDVDLSSSKSKSNILNGHINGFIDLLFEHGGKYYILDWKSNYLGNRVADYTPEKIKEAMEANNYHLQYLLYMVAAVRFLNQIIPNFDYKTQFGGVFYIFLRGVQEGTQNGVFFRKPKWEEIEKVDQLFQGSEGNKSTKTMELLTLGGQ